MASYNRVTFGGSSNSLQVPFPYLDKAHVQVRLNNVLQPTSSYVWTSSGLIQLNATPATGVVGEARRVTPIGQLVSFQPGNLDTNDLNIANLQSIFISEEATDYTQGIADDYENTLAAVEVAKQAAQGALVAASTAASDAVESVLKTVQVVIDGIEQTAQAAQQSAANANQAASNAAANAAEAVADVLEQAQVAAQAAEAAAARADQFDPLNFYTKGQADSTFLTSASAEMGFFTKAQVNEKFTSYYTKTAVDVAMSQRVAKSGDAMTGNLTIQKQYPLIEYRGTGTDKWWSYHDTGDACFKLSYNEAVRFQVNSGGAIWTAQLGDLNTRIEDRAYAHADARAWAVANDRVANLNSRWVSRGDLFTQAGGAQQREAPAGAAITGFFFTQVDSYSNASINRFYYRYFQLFDPVRGWITAHYA